LAVALDDVALMYCTVGERGDLPDALVLVHHHSTMGERLNKDDGLIGGHGKAVVSALLSSALHPCLKMADPRFVE
jgi:hypothetical protein